LLVIPAIDLKNGRCVRLRQGRIEDETVFSDVPERMAEKWFEAGAERLHVVDLDGAFKGKPVNSSVIRRIVDSVPIPVQLGGGIRDVETLKAYFDLGVKFVILGTVAFRDPEFVVHACNMFPGQIIIGIDAKKGRVAIEGWTEEIDMGPVDMARRFEDSGACAIVYTDIQRDGMRSGPNLDATASLAKAVKIPVIASGGISDIEDVQSLLPLEKLGVIGMITGRALYDGSLNLAEAIKLCRSSLNTGVF